MNKVKLIFFGNSYYILLIVISILILLPTFVFKLHNIFYVLYKFNYNSINTSLSTIFGVLFAFVFTILTILFSLKEDSVFFKLIQANNRNKKYIIHYFCISTFSLFIVLIIFLFLTITYIPDNVLVQTGYLTTLSKINNPLIYSLIYFIEFSMINIVLLLITFIMIIRD